MTPTTRRCWVEIRTRSLEYNYRFLRDLAGPGVECLAVIKADAYGHSLALCAPAAVRAGAGSLGVTSLEEALAARACAPDSRILVMGGIFPGQGAVALANTLTPVIWDAGHVDELESAARAAGALPHSVAVHLEIDTGMSRQGAAPEDLPALLAPFTAQSPLRVEAVMTHLYASDEAYGETTPVQLGRFEEALTILRNNLSAASPQPAFLSVGATAALLGGTADELRAIAARWNLQPMFRIGLALYGIVPRFDPDFAPGCAPAALESARRHLKPVLAWKTRIVSLCTVPAGAEVGYNGTFVATEPMRLALIAAGYADGLVRRLGNRFSLLVRGQRAPLVGRVSMDQAVVDVTEIPGAAPGDEVVILGEQGSQTITVFDHAKAIDTIPWEVFTRIAARVPRLEAGSESSPAGS